MGVKNFNFTEEEIENMTIGKWNMIFEAYKKDFNFKKDKKLVYAEEKKKVSLLSL